MSTRFVRPRLIRFLRPRDLMGQPTAPPPKATGRKTRKVETAILEALRAAAEPLKMDKLAKRATGQNAGGSVLTALLRLSEAGLIDVLDEGTFRIREGV